jgi:hypothetical protein
VYRLGSEECRSQRRFPINNPGFWPKLGAGGRALWKWENGLATNWKERNRPCHTTGSAVGGDSGEGNCYEGNWVGSTRFSQQKPLPRYLGDAIPGPGDVLSLSAYRAGLHGSGEMWSGESVNNGVCVEFLAGHIICLAVFSIRMIFCHE